MCVCEYMHFTSHLRSSLMVLERARAKFSGREQTNRLKISSMQWVTAVTSTQLETR